MTLPNPLDAEYGFAVCRVLRYVADGPETDNELPDTVAATGTVSFAPTIPVGKSVSPSAFTARETLTAVLDDEGRMVSPVNPAVLGLWLHTGTYQVTFALGAGSLPSLTIEVLASHTPSSPLDLVTAAPYTPPSGVTVQTLIIPSGVGSGDVLVLGPAGLVGVPLEDLATGGGVSVHGDLTGRDADDAHPITAITGLDEALASIPTQPSDIGAATAEQGSKADSAVQPGALHAVATSGAYSDLAGTPSIPSAPGDIGAVADDDSRLTNSRTPTAHKSTHATGGTDALTPADIGAATSGHTHAAPDLSGYVPTSRTVNGKPLSANITLSAADVGASTFSGAYGDLSGRPTLGTAAATASTDYATAAQGAKADAAIPSGLVDAKGDLIVATADNTVTRLPAGTNGHVLTADSGEAAGVKWAAPSGGGGESLNPLNFRSSFIPRSGQWVPSGSLLNSHWNTVPVVSATNILLVQRSGNASATYRWVVYKSDGTPNGLTLVYTTPEFSSPSGEVMNVIPATGFAMPIGLLFTALICTSGTAGTFNAGLRGTTGEPYRDLNGSGGVEISGFGTIGAGWVPPSTITVSKHFAAGGIPQVLMEGAVLS